MKQRHEGDVLLIRSARMGEAEGGWKIVDEQLHAVLPMYDLDQPPSAHPKLEFDSPLHCHLLVVEMPDGHAIFSKTQHDVTRSRMVFTDEEGKLSIDLDPEFMQEVMVGLRRTVDSR